MPLLPLLAVERARASRESAAVAVGGVVASLSLAVALTVMVASFRDSVATGSTWCCPPTSTCAPRRAAPPPTRAVFSPGVRAAAARVEGVRRVERAAHRRSLLLDPALPAVALLARPIEDPRARCRWSARSCRRAGGQMPVYVSEAVVDLYGARARAARSLAAGFARRRARRRSSSRGVWRDYVRQ